MKAYIVEVRLSDREESITFGMLSNTQKEAEQGATAHLGDIDYTIISVYVVNLKKATVKRYSKQDAKYHTYNVQVALTGGYLFYVKEDGREFKSRCKTEYRPDGKSAYCTIYGDSHEVFFN